MTNAAAPGVNPRPRSMWLRFVAMLVVPPLVWALARYDLLPHVPICMFQNMTGRPCPGCGMTRSILLLARGDVIGSLRMHPLGVPLAALFVGALVGTAAGLLRGGDPVSRFLERRGVALVISLIVLFVAAWLVRGFIVPDWSPDAVSRASAAR